MADSANTGGRPVNQPVGSEASGDAMDGVKDSIQGGSGTGTIQRSNLYLYKNPKPRELTFNIQLPSTLNGSSINMLKFAFTTKTCFPYQSLTSYYGANDGGSIFTFLNGLTLSSYPRLRICFRECSTIIKLTGMQKSKIIKSGDTSMLIKEACDLPILCFLPNYTSLHHKIGGTAGTDFTTAVCSTEWNYAQYNELVNYPNKVRLYNVGDSIEYGVHRFREDWIQPKNTVPAGANFLNVADMFKGKTIPVATSVNKKMRCLLPFNTDVQCIYPSALQSYGQNNYGKIPSGNPFMARPTFGGNQPADEIGATKLNVKAPHLDQLDLPWLAVVPSDNADDVIQEGEVFYNWARSLTFTVSIDNIIDTMTQAGVYRDKLKHERLVDWTTDIPLTLSEQEAMNVSSPGALRGYKLEVYSNI